MIPTWLHTVSLASVALGILCAVVITADISRNPQHMAVMAVVWPITALFGTILTLWLYWTYGRGRHHEDTPFWASVAKGASHCGAGCTLGDILAEFLCLAIPGVAVWFGWHQLFADRIFAVWIVDFLFAFAIGIAFQYCAIKPMSDLTPDRVLRQALKADALSLTAWQVGMYGFMAFATFVLFRDRLGVDLTADTVEFWFMMQLAMLCGFVTAYPVNWGLIRAGVKEAM